MINKDMPFNAKDIGVKWATDEGGIGVIAFTDDERSPYIGLYPLNRIGKPAGLPILFRRKAMMSDLLIGYNRGKPLIVFIDIEVSERGLSLIVFIPSHKSEHYQRHTFAPWGSEPPSYGYMAFPSNSNWVIDPFPKGGEE